MSSLLVVNCKMLVNTREQTGLLRGRELAFLPCIENGWLHIEDKEIASYGPMTDMPPQLAQMAALHTPEPEGPVIDATGRFILPAWCDSHTHLVFAGSREDEFVDKIKGLSYADINARGGGILNSAAKLAATSEDALFNEAWVRLEELARLGTGAIEIKSGYGLTVEGEL
jgi:imidazolonepropionase